MMHCRSTFTVSLWVFAAVGCSGAPIDSNDGGIHGVGGAAAGGHVATGGSTATGGTNVGGTTSTAQGDVTLSSSECAYANGAISGPGGVPDSNQHGDPVSNGGGYTVTCSVTFDGTYAVHARIESPDMVLAVDSTDVNSGATMNFFTKGSPETIRSVDGNHDPAPTCMLTSPIPGSSIVTEPGTIFAQYDCRLVFAPANPAKNCPASGFIYFTGCSS